MGSYLLKGILLIGLLFGMPVGAVGAMTIQRTYSTGVKAGLLTGLGSSVADCFYACVGAFGLTLVSDFLLKYQTIINAFGGALIPCDGDQPDPAEKGSEKTAEAGNRRYPNVSVLIRSGHHESGGNPNLSVCFFLFWNYESIRMVGRHAACSRRVYRYIYLVGIADGGGGFHKKENGKSQLSSHE